MRTLTGAVITGFIALLVAGVASAAPTVSLVWTATTGAGVAGGSTIDVVAGDILTLDIQVSPDGDGISLASVSYDYLSGGDTITNFYRTGIDSINDGFGVVYDVVNGNAVFGSASNNQGLTFEAAGGYVSCPSGAGTGNIIAGFCSNGAPGLLSVALTGSDLGGGIVGSFAALTGGAAAAAPFTIARANFLVVPEPATGGLLALGLGALGLIGRRNG